VHEADEQPAPEGGQPLGLGVDGAVVAATAMPAQQRLAPPYTRLSQPSNRIRPSAA
jgi:hypothetical protein